MLEGFQNAGRIPELRRRLLFTFGMLAVYRLGVAIPTPGIDGKALAEFFDQAQNTMFGLVNLFSGGALERFSIFALGIMPYISASIILQLLTVVIPYLERLSKEGEAGRRKITQYTRYGTVVLAARPGLLHQRRPREHAGAGRRPGGLRAGLELPPDDHASRSTSGTVVPHVARRADHRARHRQRHLAASSSPASSPACRRRSLTTVAVRARGRAQHLRAHRSRRLHGRHRRAASSSSSAASAASRCSTPSGSSGAACTAARARTCR